MHVPGLGNGKSRILAAAIVVTLFLCLSFKTESLWTDEAYSAFVACHRTYSALWQTLLAGDSSDLQMWLYYSYLHFWVALFGDRELSFRAANIPFIFLYALAIAWTRNCLFKSNWVWIAVLNPFVWAYASDARPYMCIVALSTAASICVVASSTGAAPSRALPWIALSALLLGLNLHMLMILFLAPALVFLLAHRFSSGAGFNFKTWLRPIFFLSPLFLAYFVFLAWTFERGTSYDYAKPDLLSSGAVLYRFLGLAGFAPNRHYEVAFAPYIPGMLLASLGILCAALLALGRPLRAQHSQTLSLLAALCAGLCQAPLLSFVFKQQVEVRHIACLFALLLLLFFSAWDLPTVAGKPALRVSILLLALVWAISDFRMTWLPEYRREDFRAAVAAALNRAQGLNRAQDANTQIAVIADPAAVAYYGLDIKGPRPCYPLPGACQEALNDLPWPRLHSAFQATFWSEAMIQAWLRSNGEHIVLISRSRHPMYLLSNWWPALHETQAGLPVSVQGFFVYTIEGKKY